MHIRPDTEFAADDDGQAWDRNYDHLDGAHAAGALPEEEHGHAVTAAERDTRRFVGAVVVLLAILGLVHLAARIHSTPPAAAVSCPLT